MSKPPSIETLVRTIDDIITDQSKALEPIQKDMYKKALALLKGIDTDAAGNIKQTVNNYKVIGKVRGLFKSELESDKYLAQVDMVKQHFADISGIQTSYFSAMFKEFSQPQIMNEIRNQAVQMTVESLTEAGMQDIIVNKSAKILQDNIQAGRNFKDMTDELEQLIIGDKDIDSKMTSYTKQIMSDTMHQYVGNYTKQVTEDLGLVWFEFTGGIMRDTRPMCKELVPKQFIHESEFAGICRGEVTVDGTKLTPGIAGFIDGTNKDNFLINRCGWNCQHQLIPIAAEFVPKKLRDEVEGVPAKGKEPIEITNEFVEAKSVGEAEQWAKDNLKFDIETYKGVELETANAINRNLFEFQNTYKGVINTKVRFGVQGKAYSQFDHNTNTLYFRKSYKKLNQRLLDDNNRWLKEFGKKYQISENINGIIKHELGHYIDYSTNRNIYKQIDVLDISLKNKAYGISGYAAEGRFWMDSKLKGSEMIAEITSAFYNDKKSFNALPNEIKDIFLKLF